MAVEGCEMYGDTMTPFSLPVLDHRGRTLDQRNRQSRWPASDSDSTRGGYAVGNCIDTM